MDETGRFREEQFAKLRLSFGPAEGDAQAAAPGKENGASTSGRGGGGGGGGRDGGRWGRGRDGGRGGRCCPTLPYLRCCMGLLPLLLLHLFWHRDGGLSGRVLCARS